MNNVYHRTALAIAAALCATGAMAADNVRVVPLKKLFPYLDLYSKLPAAERSHFGLAYKMKTQGGPSGALRLTYIVAGARTPVRLAPDGRVLNPPPPSALPTGQVELSSPAGSKVALDLEVVASAQPASEMDARDFASALKQASAAIHKAAGMMSFAAPKMERVTFKGAAGGQVVTVAGKASVLPVIAGSPVFDPAKATDARWIRFTRPPVEIDLGPAK